MSPFRLLAIGALGGSAALVTDVLLASLIVGDWLSLEFEFCIAYVACGVIASVIVYPLARYLKTTYEFLAAIIVVIYIPSIFERLYVTIEFRADTSIAIAVSVAAIAAFAGWVIVLVNLVDRDKRFGALVIGAGTAAIGLAVNRNLINFPSEPFALLIDAVVIGLGLASVLMLRRFDGKTMAVFVIAAALMSVSVTKMVMTSGLSASDNLGVPPVPRPNLLMIVVDTLRADVFEDVLVTTGEGQAFSEVFSGSVYFDRSYAASPWTAPSMGSIMTGLYPHQHGFGVSSKDPSRPLRRLKESALTLAEGLRAHGYATMAIGANTMLHPASGIDRGFDHYEIVKDGSEKLPLMTLLEGLGITGFEAYQDAETLRGRFDAKIDDLVDVPKPFFLWLQFMDPHAPLVDHPELPPDLLTRPLPKLDRLYRNEVRYTLRSVLQIAKTLKRHRVWDDTVVVFVADHGEMLPSDQHMAFFRDKRGRSRKYGHGHALFEELVRIPLLFRAGGSWAGIRRSSEMVSHIDLMITLNDLLGTDITTEGSDAISVGALVRDRDANSEGRDIAFMGAVRAGPAQYAMRCGDLKIIHYLNQDRRSRLFDLSVDPGEQVNRDIDYEEELESAIMKLRDFFDAANLMTDDDTTVLDAETLRRLEALGYGIGS